MMVYNSDDLEYGEKAIQKWMATHKIGDGWSPSFGYFLKKLPIVVLYNGQETMPWCVQYAGNGHYFKTRETALNYFESRIEKAKKMREYNRKYRSENKEKIKESRKNHMIMSALKYLNEHPEEIDKIRGLQAVPERKKGKWNEPTWDDIKSGKCGSAECICSLCGAAGLEFDNFCYNCGADMRGEQE